MRACLVVLGLLLALAPIGCSGKDEKDLEDAYAVRVPFISKTGDLPLEEGGPVRIEGKEREVGEVVEVREIDETERFGPPPHATHMTTLAITDEQAAPLPYDSTFRVTQGGVEIDRGHTSSTYREGDTVSVKVTYAVP